MLPTEISVGVNVFAVGSSTVKAVEEVVKVVGSSMVKAHDESSARSS